MKLSSFFVENFKCIGREVHIKIDDIIILIGQNNVGKSTILDAYEKFAALGAKWHLNRSQFGIRIDHDLASIFDHSLASQSITIWHASDH
ncbi:AAA family ATPase [Escherichia coli]|nr:ATP-binding protein [Escherichia coli]